MTREARRVCVYLEHILAAIDRIAAYTASLDHGTFLKNPLVQDAVIRNLEIIGEASHAITRRFPAFSKRHPTLPLGPAYQMRNALIHGYISVDLDVVWRTVRNDLPTLRDQVQACLNDEDVDPT